MTHPNAEIRNLLEGIRSNTHETHDLQLVKKAIEMLGIEVPNVVNILNFYSEFYRKIEEHFRGGPPKIVYMAFLHPDGKHWLRVPIFLILPKPEDRDELLAKLTSLQNVGTVAYDIIKIANKNVIRVFVLELFPKGISIWRRAYAKVRGRIGVPSIRPRVKSLVARIPGLRRLINKTLLDWIKHYNKYERWWRAAPREFKHLCKLLESENNEIRAYNYFLNTFLKYLSLHGKYKDLYGKLKKAVEKAKKEVEKLKKISDDFKDIKKLYLDFLNEIEKKLSENPELVGSPGILLLIKFLSEIFEALAKDAGKVEGDPIKNLRNAIDIVKELSRKYRSFYGIFSGDLRGLLVEIGRLTKESLALEYVLKRLASYVSSKLEELRGLRDDFVNLIRQLRSQRVERSLLISAKNKILSSRTVFEEILEKMRKDYEDLKGKGYEKVLGKIEKVVAEFESAIQELNTLEGIDIEKIPEDELKGASVFLLNIMSSLLSILNEIMRYGG